jgi:hypothetical protein
MAFYAIMFQYRGKSLAVKCTASSLKQLVNHQSHVPIEDMEKLSVWFPVLPSVMLCCHTALCRLQPVVGAVISALTVAHHRGRVLVFVAQDSCNAKRDCGAPTPSNGKHHHKLAQSIETAHHLGRERNKKDGTGTDGHCWNGVS